ncbi:ATP-binding protein [Brevibacillus sp. NRS-1366]|uniref:ATP-binding protein n=1 Tax=Brevibacillus sp. NRS-1366 TaxID=3233899 RepID=UPI003D1A05BD
MSIQRKFRDVNAIVYGKKNQIKKALFNLLKNAFEAIPDKGTITVEHYIEEENVVISIEDTGIGIPKDKLLMLGTPFYTTKIEGTGMGLTQVFSVFKSHNAIVNVESSENQGTKFVVKIHMDNPNKIIGVNDLDLEYLEGYDFAAFLKENKPKFENRLLHEAVTVKEKIDEILRVGNIDLLSNAYKLVLYVVEGREHEMISFAK